MPEITETAAESAPVLSPRERKRAIASWEVQRKRELDASLAVLRARQSAERMERLRKHIIDLWPLWVGIYLGALSSVIQPLAAAIGPGCVTFIYPFVELARRPEVQAGPITYLLPSIMLYAQFPIEGFLAYVVLRRRSRPFGVIWQVFLFHFIGLMELWMIKGGAAVLVGH